MRSFVVAFILLCALATGSAQVAKHEAGVSGYVKLTATEWRKVRAAFRNLDGKAVAGMIDPSKGVRVAYAFRRDDKSKARRVTKAEIIAAFAKVKQTHKDPRNAGPLVFAWNLPRNMPKPDSKYRYYFDSGPEDGPEDDSYVRFVVRNGHVWLDEVVGFGNLEIYP